MFSIRTKLSYYLKTDDKDIAENIETKLDTSNYYLGRALPKGKKVILLMKDELGGKIMKKLVGLRAKTYIYLADGCSENKKNKRHKKVCHQKKK